MKLSRLACCCAFVLTGTVWAGTVQADNPFDELDSEVTAVYSSAQTEQEEYLQFVLAYMNEYENWRSQYLREYDAYRAQIIEKWGDGLVSEPLVTVDYSRDQKTRTVVDLERNEAIVAVLVEPNMLPEQAEKAVKQAAKTVMGESGSTLASVVESPKVLESGSVVMVEVNYSNVTETAAKKVIQAQTRTQLQEIEKESEALVAQLRATVSTDLIDTPVVASAIEKKKVQLQQQEQLRIKKLEKTYQIVRQQAAKQPPKTVMEYRIKLPTNGIGKRAAKYVGFAEQESQRFDIPAALVMAIMHSESSFNPKAKSPIPAYGLMQIVPTTAGRDVNVRIRRKDEPMSPAELYVADVNVETGTAYLNILDKSYLKAITNDESRLYCTIAAYNTGAGNVAKAFNPDGSRKIYKAAKIINSMTPQQVYDKLMADLPYDETKHYLKKVSTRIRLYEKHSA